MFRKSLLFLLFAFCAVVFALTVNRDEVTTSVDTLIENAHKKDIEIGHGYKITCTDEPWIGRSCTIQNNENLNITEIGIIENAWQFDLTSKFSPQCKKENKVANIKVICLKDEDDGKIWVDEVYIKDFPIVVYMEPIKITVTNIADPHIYVEKDMDAAVDDKIDRYFLTKRFMIRSHRDESKDVAISIDIHDTNVVGNAKINFSSATLNVAVEKNANTGSKVYSVSQGNVSGSFKVEENEEVDEIIFTLLSECLESDKLPKKPTLYYRLLNVGAGKLTKCFMIQKSESQNTK